MGEQERPSQFKKPTDDESEQVDGASEYWEEGVKKIKETKPKVIERIDVLKKWRFSTDVDPFQGEILNDASGVLYKGR